MAQPFVPADPDMRRLLEETRTVAVVGLSDNPMRPSYGVARYLYEVGYRVIPVNPKLTELWGLKAYPDLDSARRDGIVVDMVDVFRDPAHVPQVVDETLRAGAKSLWLQEGVVHPEAAQRASQAGLTVVMDRCVMKEHARLVA